MELKSAWLSKINWTQMVGFIAVMLAAFGVDLDPDTQVAIVAAIAAVTQIVTWIIKTWFTTSITPASVRK
jgi:hypothetical protein